MKRLKKLFVPKCCGEITILKIGYRCECGRTYTESYCPVCKKQLIDAQMQPIWTCKNCGTTIEIKAVTYCSNICCTKYMVAYGFEKTEGAPVKRKCTKCQEILEEYEEFCPPICCNQRMIREHGYRCTECRNVYELPHCNRCRTTLTHIEKCGIWLCGFCKSALPK